MAASVATSAEGARAPAASGAPDDGGAPNAASVASATLGAADPASSPVSAGVGVAIDDEISSNSDEVGFCAPVVEKSACVGACAGQLRHTALWWLAPLLVLCAGAAATLAVFNAAEARELEQLAVGFDEVAEAQFQAVLSAAAAADGLLAATNRLCALGADGSMRGGGALGPHPWGHETATRAWAESILLDPVSDFVFAIGIVARVPAAQRARYEAVAGAEHGLPAGQRFNITTPGTGQVAPEGADVYYPVVYVYPTTPALGVDLGAIPDRRSLLEACEAAPPGTVCTAAVTLLTGAAGVLPFQAVHTNFEEESPVSLFSNVVIDVRHLVTAALSDVDVDSSGLAITISGAADGQTIVPTSLYSGGDSPLQLEDDDSRFRRATDRGAACAWICATPPPLVAERDIDVLGLKWRMRVEALAPWAESHETSNSDVIAGVSIAVVVVAASAVALAADVARRAHDRASILAAAEASRLTHNRVVRLMCHELRNPVHAVSGTIRSVLTEFGARLDSDTRADLRTALTSMRGVSLLVSDVLDLEQLRAGSVRVVNEECDVRALLRDLMNEYREVAERRGVDIEVQASFPEVVLIDRLRLRQVLGYGLTAATQSIAPSNNPIRIRVFSPWRGEKAMLCQVLVPMRRVATYMRSGSSNSSYPNAGGASVRSSVDGRHGKFVTPAQRLSRLSSGPRSRSSRVAREAVEMAMPSSGLSMPVCHLLANSMRGRADVRIVSAELPRSYSMDDASEVGSPVVAASPPAEGATARHEGATAWCFWAVLPFGVVRPHRARAHGSAPSPSMRIASPQWRGGSSNGRSGGNTLGGGTAGGTASSVAGDSVAELPVSHLANWTQTGELGDAVSPSELERVLRIGIGNLRVAYESLHTTSISSPGTKEARARRAQRPSSGTLSPASVDDTAAPFEATLEGFGSEVTSMQSVRVEATGAGGAGGSHDAGVEPGTKYQVVTSSMTFAAPRSNMDAAQPLPVMRARPLRHLRKRSPRNSATAPSIADSSRGRDARSPIAAVLDGSSDDEKRRSSSSTRDGSDQSAPSDEAVVEAGMGIISLEGVRVLLVDDDRLNRRVGQRMLKALGCECTLATDGDEVLAAVAAAAADEKPFDVVLLDIVMRRVDGISACASLRASGSVLPIAAVTANTGESDVARYMSSGFDLVLGKPFQAESLRALLCRLLARKRGLGHAAAAGGRAAAD